jgi:N-acetylglucosaminyldiphosphoundecaprenol N-acetyl-beta-D-mannosaminyltransferase
MMLDVCAEAERAGVAVYLYGSTAATLDQLSRKLRRRFPTLHIAGVESPPFGAVTDEELRRTGRRIAESGAGIVFVGLGAPRQESRMLHLRAHTPAVLLGVGAAFDFHAGTLRRAPRWMRTAGLEWLHRFASEPRRLARRYLVGNTHYVLLALRQLTIGRAARVTGGVSSR